MKITIRTAENGYIAGEEVEIEEGFKALEETVIEETDEKEGITNLLLHIVSKFGKPYDKWSSENINITWDKKGHKVD